MKLVLPLFRMIRIHPNQCWDELLIFGVLESKLPSALKKVLASVNEFSKKVCSEVQKAAEW